MNLMQFWRIKKRKREIQITKKVSPNLFLNKIGNGGNLTLVETKTFYADEHTTVPNCGVVDYGNENCFKTQTKS